MKKTADVRMWAMGKVEPGWYCAGLTFDEKVAKEWRSQGYDVRTSQDMPPEEWPRLGIKES